MFSRVVMDVHLLHDAQMVVCCSEDLLTQLQPLSVVSSQQQQIA